MARGYFVPDCAKYHVPGFLAAGATAILCGNDLIAQGVYDECRARGLRIPEDISVVGFDDLPPAASFTPPLTTIRQELNELGRCGYVMLESLIRHIPISQTLMRPSLIERDSTARVASAPSGSNGDLK
jgi:LacI family transcriptional regulator